MDCRASFYSVALGATVVLSSLALGCQRSQIAVEAVQAEADTRPSPLDATSTPPAVDLEETVGESTSGQDAAPFIDRLRRRGRFAEFVAAALARASEAPADPAANLLAVEALLASGRNEEAAGVAQVAIEGAIERSDTARAAQGLKLWAVARLRSRQPLDESWVDRAIERVSASDASAQFVGALRTALAGHAAYRLDSGDSALPAEIRAAGAAPGSVPAELCAIEAVANEERMPLVFIDTGAQHTVMSVAAAHTAGVELSSGATHLVGFAALNTRLGVLRTLRLGSLILHDVPVLVGDSTPLVALGGQMALGTELMQHVRFTIDYPARRVWAEPVAAPLTAEWRDDAVWEIPLWTFSQACLAQAKLDGGAMARVLVDTGDRAGTYLARSWARRNLPQFQRPNGHLVFKFKPRNLVLDRIELGGRPLEAWPVLAMFPNELERLDTVDLLLGHDLLGRYRLSIDVAGRTLRLIESQPLPTNAIIEQRPVVVADDDQ